MRTTGQVSGSEGQFYISEPLSELLLNPVSPQLVYLLFTGCSHTYRKHTCSQQMKVCCLHANVCSVEKHQPDDTDQNQNLKLQDFKSRTEQIQGRSQPSRTWEKSLAKRNELFLNYRTAACFQHDLWKKVHYYG